MLHAYSITQCYHLLLTCDTQVVVAAMMMISRRYLYSGLQLISINVLLIHVALNSKEYV